MNFRMSPRTPEEECARDTADAIHLDPETDMLVKKATQLLANLFQVALYFQPYLVTVLRIRDPVPFLTPGSGAFLTPGSEMGKKSRSGSGMIIPDHFSESLETIFWAKHFFNALIADPDSGIFLTLDPG
jgi:hypothetical protein